MAKRRINFNNVGFAALGRTLMQNNRAQFSKKERELRLTSKKEKWVDHKKASPELLKEIRLKLKQQEKKEWNLTLLSFLGAIFLIYLLTQMIDFRYLWYNFR